MSELDTNIQLESDNNLAQLETINTLHDQQEHDSNNNDLLSTNKNDIVDTYLKKHKLDLKLLPNKKMIKLSDLSNRVSKSNLINSSVINNNNNNNATTTKITETSIDNTSIPNKNSESTVFNQDIETNEGEVDEEDYDEFESGSDYDYEEEEEEEEEEDKNQDSNCSKDQVSTNSELDYHEKIIKRRKKREPSLKLKQKLSKEDLELIVGCVRDKQAEVHIADVKRENHVDKILNVKLLNKKLSNGKTEALLKKSMFAKDLNTLFDMFINSIFDQDYITDSNGVTKPALKCLVVKCDFKSVSEAEMMRHLKRHLAQDGYTCLICSHQFASMTNLQRHARIHNGSVGKEVKCQHCDYKASTITHVKRHMAHKHLERSLPCPHCSFMGATNAELKIHMARKHLELTGKNPLFLPKYLRKDYQCSICKEQYNDFKEYQTHMYEHTSSSNKFQCSECPYNCKNYSKLKRHMLYHMGARNFECKLCGNKFFQMEHLKRHMLSIHNVTNIDQSMINVPSNFQINNTTMNQNSNSVNINNNSNNRIGKKKTTLPLKNQNNLFKKNITSQLSNNDSIDILFDSQRTRTVDNKETIVIKNDFNISKSQFQQNNNFEQIISEKTLKKDLNSVYKCQKCEFSTDKLFTLNEHSIDQHLKDNDISLNVQHQSLVENDDFSNIQIDQDEEDKNEENLVKELRIEKFGSCYPCAFCSFKTNEKFTLKCHLSQCHSTQVTDPVVLSNEVAETQSNIKYQCGNCKQLLNNIDEFVKHMDENHKVQVIMLDSINNSNNNPQIHGFSNNVGPQIQLNSHQPVQIANKNAQLAPKPAKQQKVRLYTKKSQQNKRINGEHQQIRSFINSASHISRQYNQNQNATVRINPLLLKRHSFLFKQNQQQLEQQQQQIHQLAQQLANETNSTNSSSNLIIINQDDISNFNSNSSNNIIINQIVESIDLIQESDDKLLQLIS